MCFPELGAMGLWKFPQEQASSRRSQFKEVLVFQLLATDLPSASSFCCIYGVYASWLLIL